MNPDDRTPPAEHQDKASKDTERKQHEESHKRHDERLDEGVEETFPASDPVAVKHIS